MKHYIFILVSFFLVISRSAVSIPSCPAIDKELSLCKSFLQGKDLTPFCCEGVDKIRNAVKTKADRVAMCNCGKKLLSHFKYYHPKRLTILPKVCGILHLQLPPISKKFDCSKVH